MLLMVNGLLLQLDVFKPFSATSDIRMMKSYSIYWLKSFFQKNREK
jgi:hypothetical protein